MENITLYVDGSFLTEFGCGGYAVVNVDNTGKILIDDAIVGAQASSGCQEMELIAVITAIKSFSRDAAITVYTDHKTICDVLSKPERSKCEQGPNRNLWNQLRQLCASRHVSLQWVRAHCGNLANGIADELARSAAKQFKINNLTVH